jgi:hypothetical protein
VGLHVGGGDAEADGVAVAGEDGRGRRPKAVGVGAEEVLGGGSVRAEVSA